MRKLAATAVLVAFLAACGAGGSDNPSPEPSTTLAGGSTTTAPPRPPGYSAPLPEGRTELAGTAWKGRIAAVGGLSADGDASARFDIYNPADDTWVEGPELPVGLHHAAALAPSDGRLWVIGGYTIEAGEWVPTSKAWSIDQDEQEWRPEPSLSVARGALAGTVVGDVIVVAGGTTSVTGQPEGVSRTVEFLTPGQKRWNRAPDLFEQREHLAMATSGNRVLAIGGRIGGLDSNLRSVESWHPGEGTWRRELPLRKARGGFSAASAATGACVAGGEEPGRTISLVECRRGGQWKVVAQLDEARHGVVVAVLAGRLHVIGGGPRPGLTVSDLHEVLDIGD